MPTFPPIVQKFADDLDKRLHEPGIFTNFLGTAEQKTGVRRLYIVAGLVALHALYLLFGCGAELLCNVTGFLYPAYVSINAIETASKEDDTQWLTYWVVFGLLNVVEFFSSTIVYYFPFYWLLKCSFLLYLHAPITLGAQKLYSSVIRPYYIQYHNVIDDALTSASDHARKAYEEHVKPN